MAVPITDQLCANCGLCCDGSLLADVELAGRREADQMETLGMEVEDGESDGRDALLMPLPCSALCGTRCSIYAHRPETCRTFECRLLKETIVGNVAVENALAVVSDVKCKVGRIRQLLSEAGAMDAGAPLAELVHDGLLAIAEQEKENANPSSGHELRRLLDEFEELVESRFL